MTKSPSKASSISKKPIILVAEDDSGTREVLKELLEGEGYRVMACENGEKAIEIINKYREQIALVLTDNNMGQGPTGIDVAHAAQNHSQPISVIVCSGDSQDELIKGLKQKFCTEELPSSVRLLGKPFDLNAFKTMADSLLAP